MKNLALPKSNLITESWEFDKIYRRGKRIKGDNFSLIFIPNDNTENRLGISIHGRLKGAVKRNRIKRIIREFFRQNRRFIPPGNDIVFTVRTGFSPKNPTDVEQAVSCLLR